MDSCNRHLLKLDMSSFTPEASCQGVPSALSAAKTPLGTPGPLTCDIHCLLFVQALLRGQASWVCLSAAPSNFVNDLALLAVACHLPDNLQHPPDLVSSDTLAMQPRSPSAKVGWRTPAQDNGNAAETSRCIPGLAATLVWFWA